MPKNNRTRRPSMNNAISEKPQCAACSISPHTKPIKIHQSTAEFITISKMQQDMTKCLKSNWGWRAMTLVLIYLVHPRTHLACPNSMTTTPSDWDFSGCARLATPMVLIATSCGQEVIASWRCSVDLSETADAHDVECNWIKLNQVKHNDIIMTS